ncbi:MAG: hypothetical protein ACT4OJ_14210 [Bacteroidota bacterium]
MKQLLIIILTALLSGCSNNNPKPQAEKESEKKLSKWEGYMKAFKDSVDLSSDIYDLDAAHFDTANISTSPIAITETTIWKEKEYLGLEYDNISVRFRNISGKTIEAVKLRWFCEDAFGEPVFLFSRPTIRMSIGQGRSNEQLKPGGIGQVRWRGNATDLYKVVRAWPYEVAFSDGIVWKIYEKMQVE